jgi:hypothetical protein
LQAKFKEDQEACTMGCWKAWNYITLLELSYFLNKPPQSHILISKLMMLQIYFHVTMSKKSSVPMLSKKSFVKLLPSITGMLDGAANPFQNFPRYIMQPNKKSTIIINSSSRKTNGST